MNNFLFTAIQNPFSALSDIHPLENSIIALTLIVLVMVLASFAVTAIKTLVTTAPNRRRIMFTSAIALQFVALSAMAAPHAYTYATGKEVVLMSEPVDPYALFRGDYVTLGYKFTRSTAGFDLNEPVWVVLENKGNQWEHVKVTGGERPATADNQIALRGNIDEYSSRIKCGIEQFYVPEGKGRELERHQHLKVTIAVDQFGHAVVKNVQVP
jgi:uncharacterized membrane-anchored protein